MSHHLRKTGHDITLNKNKPSEETEYSPPRCPVCSLRWLRHTSSRMPFIVIEVKCERSLFNVKLMKVSCSQLLSLTMKMFIELCVVVPYDFIFFIYLFTVLFMFCLIYSLVLAILNVWHRRGYIGIFTALWNLHQISSQLFVIQKVSDKY